MNLSQIIERKKHLPVEQAIRESVEEALQEVRPEGHVEEEVGFNDCLKDYNQRIKEFMK